jgi:hypothetical protein
LIAATLASAPQPEVPVNPAAEAVVHKTLIKPLAVKEERQSRFSRARLPAAERKVRILSAELSKDSQGAAFVRFEVDVRHGYADVDDDGNELPRKWRTAAITGCVYPERGEVFVNKGEKLFPAALLLGKKSSAASEQTCRAADAQLAQAR